MSDIIISHLDQQLNEAQAEIHRLAQQNLSLRKSLERDFLKTVTPGKINNIELAILVGASSKEELQEMTQAIDTLLSLD